MSESSKVILKKALELSAIEKAQVIEALLNSLDTPDASIDKVWAAEADARVEAFERGEIDAVPAETVLGKYSRS